jgi:hypothetical protein
MMRRLSALILITLATGACAARQPAPVAPTAHLLGSRCPPGTPCAPKQASPLRQFYDVSHRRYYYYDPLTYHYYWENGAPRT